ncbi:MAG: hypothetical protein IPK18_04040 [Sphingobacteriales bacterium]|jgi:hypothetical protein|nr:MAG: hypothetical protein IPK18_04040 [Sphingobacteriales bacterium]
MSTVIGTKRSVKKDSNQKSRFTKAEIRKDIRKSYSIALNESDINRAVLATGIKKRNFEGKEHKTSK